MQTFQLQMLSPSGNVLAPNCSNTVTQITNINNPDKVRSHAAQEEAEGGERAGHMQHRRRPRAGERAGHMQHRRRPRAGERAGHMQD